MRLSKTKIGAVLAGIGTIVGTVGAYILGDIELVKAISLVISEVGVIFLIFGIRGWPILNGGKR